MRISGDQPPKKICRAVATIAARDGAVLFDFVMRDASCILRRQFVTELHQSKT